MVADLTGSQPDGIALAADGTMFVGCYRPDRVWRIPPGGEPEILGSKTPTASCSTNPRTRCSSATDWIGLLLTSLGGWNLVTADVGVAGVPLRYPVL